MITKFVGSGERLWLSGSVGPMLGVLDSSFNPPNLAHLKLAKLLRQYYPECTLVLMLSTGNADKPSAPVQDLQHRYEMMQEFAKELDETVIALTTEPFFVAKSKALRQVAPDSRQVFAMGVDTLVRLYDQKYYNSPVTQIMNEFYQWAEILALDREPDEVSGNPAINLDFLEKEIENKQIKVATCDNSTLNVSSSRARQLTDDLDRLVPSTVAAYIRANNLYK